MHDVIAIGSATHEVIVQAKGLQTVRSPKFSTGAGACVPFGSKVGIDALTLGVGGSATNAAVTFARRGFRSAVVSKMGKDTLGDELVRGLRAEHVDTRLVVRDRRHMTAYSILLLDSSGERTILTYRGAESEMTPGDIPFSRLRASWFYMTHQSGKAAPVFAKALRHAQRIGAKVAVNPGKTQLDMSIAKLRPLLNLIDVFILNREEAAELTRTPYGNVDGIFQKLDAWVRGLVVMTDGPRGVSVSDGTTRWHAGILKERKLVDRTGAGDAFGSGFVSGLLERNSVPYAIQLGSANATSNIEQIGAQTGLLHKRDSITRWGKLRITQQKIKNRK